MELTLVAPLPCSSSVSLAIRSCADMPRVRPPVPLPSLSCGIIASTRIFFGHTAAVAELSASLDAASRASDSS